MRADTTSACAGVSVRVCAATGAEACWPAKARASSTSTRIRGRPGRAGGNGGLQEGSTSIEIGHAAKLYPFGECVYLYGGDADLPIMAQRSVRSWRTDADRFMAVHTRFGKHLG